MPTKKSTKKVSAKDGNSYSFDKFKASINKNFSLYVIGVLLLVAGFAGGSLWQENAMLKSGVKPTAVANAPTAPEAVAPDGPSKDQLNKMPKVTAEDHIRGNKNAKVILVEYSDYECPYCKKFHTTMKDVLKEYGNDVAWVYRQYPLSFHASAQKAAETAECVGKLGGSDAFWAFSDLYFETTDSSGTGVAVEDMPALAAKVGVNQAAVKTCLDSGEMEAKIKNQFDKGNAAGVSGTPGTLIVTKDGVQELIPGALPLASIKQAIDNYL